MDFRRAYALPYDLDKYFVRTDNAIEVSVLDIVPGESHAVEKANYYMLQAYLGKKNKRKPITLVHRERGGYKCIDGNSTLANAIANSWPTILAEIGED